MYDPPFWKPLTTIIWLQYCRNVLHGGLTVECVRKKNTIMFFSQCQWLHEWKDTTYLYMYALIQMVERLAVVDIAGLGAGTQFW